MEQLYRIEKELMGPYMMIAGIIGFIFSIIFTVNGKFAQWFGYSLAEGEKFDFGTNLGVALSIGFFVIFVASLFEITPRMVDRD